MRRNCDELRRRALKHGEGSAEYEVWVRHSRHCPNCRNEVYIQSLLRSDAEEDVGHLPAENISRLMRLAEQRYAGRGQGRRRAWRRAWGWCWRITASVAAACAVAGVAVRLEIFGARVHRVTEGRVSLSRYERQLSQALAETASLFGAELYGVPSVNGAEDEPQMPVASQATFAPLAPSEEKAARPVIEQATLTEASAYSMEPEMLSGWRVDGVMQECRGRIGRHRERLFQAIDEDYAGGFGHVED